MITSSLSFIHWWILLTPIVFITLLFLTKRTPTKLKLSPISWFEHIPISFNQKIGKLLRWISFIGLVICISIGASAPVREVIPDEDKARNIFLVIDTSLSMREKDFYDGLSALTRMEGIKKVVKTFIKQRAGDRIGIVVFGGRSFLLSPLTKDINFLDHSVDALQPGIGGDGTALGDGIAVALQRLEKIDQQAKAIIVVTDGASNAGNVQPTVAAKIAANLGVKIHSVGIGDANQESYDEATLKAISKTADGVFRNASDVSALMDVTKEIELLIESLSPNSTTKGLIHYSKYFASVSIVLFIIYCLVNFRFFKRIGTGITAKTLAVPLILLSILILTAAYSPQIGDEITFSTNSSSYTTVIAIDLSASMDATDVAPSRIEKIKKDIKKAIKKNAKAGQKLALVGFAGTAQVISPPTDDLDTVIRLVDSLNTQLISERGTNIAEALSVSTSLITNSQGQTILITDGETDQKEDVLFVAKNSQNPISTLPVGTSQGASLGGANITVKVDTELLAQIAKLSSGALLESFNMDLPKINKENSTQTFRIKNEIGWIFLTAALIVIFICQYFIKLPLFIPLLIVVLVNVNSSPAFADDISTYEGMKHYNKQQYKDALEKLSQDSAESSDWETMSRLGATKFKLNEFKEASQYYSNSLDAAQNPTQKFSSHYNLGNSFLAENSFDNAISQYDEALAINPDSIEAKTNRQIAMQRKEQENKNDSSNQDKENQNNSDKQSSDAKDKNNDDSNKNDSNNESTEQHKSEPNNPSTNQEEEDSSKQQAKEWLNALPDAPVIIRQEQQKDFATGSKQWW